MTGSSTMVDHGVGETCFGTTQALCNTCGELTDAKIVFRSGRVFLLKWCPAHGQTEALISSDQEWYLNSLSYIKPGTEPLDRAVKINGPCPEVCGLCPRHEQHTCLPIVEVTGRCDLDCPICLVERGELSELDRAEFGRILDGLVRAEGKLNMLNLSGGEPLLHPRLLTLVDDVRARPEIGVLSVSTNGLALARDDDLIRALRDRNVVISLQFDGFDPEVYASLRGRRELADIKRRLLDRLLEFQARISLTVTLARGINEQEIGEIFDLFFSHDEILSVMIQPLAALGFREPLRGYDPLDVITVPDVVRLIDEQTGGVLRAADFTPLPCSHPSCFALTYLLKTAAGDHVALPRIIDAGSYLDVIKNQALLGTDYETLTRLREALYFLWSASVQIPERDEVLSTVRHILLELNALDGDGGYKEFLDIGLKHVKSVFIHDFMDRASFDLGRVMKCCNHYTSPDRGLLPACVRNNIKR